MNKISLSHYSKLTQNHKILGNYGEKLAVQYIKKTGSKVLYRNFKPYDFGAKGGEIDIVARDEDTLAFIEVKTRSSYHKRAYDAVDKTKQSYIKKGASYWLRELKQAVPYRFDIIEVYLVPQEQEAQVDALIVPEIIWTKNAF